MNANVNASAVPDLDLHLDLPGDLPVDLALGPARGLGLRLALSPPNLHIFVVERKKKWNMTISHFLITF